MFDKSQKTSISKIAKILRVPTASLLAVIEVESGGKFQTRVNDRNEPLIRFEGHYFDRFLRGEEREEARNQGLASPVPGRVKNPRTQKARWNLLNKAIAINRIAALSSCSWGAGQVMGAHWKWLGYGSIDALVADARSGIVGQTKLMARYIEKAGLCEALRQQDWPKFARTYNGPSYAKNKYDLKMAAAFERYKADETTPSLPNSAAIESTSGLRFGSRGPHVSKLQKGLSKLGYILVVDGLFGLVTDRVVRQFQRDNLLQENGIVGAVEENLIFKVDILRKIKRKLPTGSNVTITTPFFAPGHCSRKASDLFSGIIGKTSQRLLSIARRFA